ncbi:MAG: bifunctional diguanylate cyclase/phosphodiesterase [Chromatiales bacterium]|nr:bifunctional diguanylate cyclase/phosphodiesterase [Chromatiales bacterium]
MSDGPDNRNARRTARRESLRVVALYLLVAVAWIGFSDQVLLQWIDNPVVMARLQTLKGIGFVVVSAIGLYVLVGHGMRMTLRSAELERQLRYDPLTGLPNRETLLSMMQPLLQIARERRTALAVVAVHVDELRQINESLGIGAGDQVLAEVSARLRAELKSGDLLARATGNTFVAVVDDPMHAEGIRDIARTVLRCLAEPLQVNGVECRVSGSVGISRFPEDHAQPAGLLEAAEAALARARTMTGWRVSFYSAGFSQAATARFRLENDLRRAIDEHQLSLFFQPQVRLADSQPCGVEALLRWHHPELGEIPPGQFIALAEETGLIVPLGEWLLESACSEARRWLDDGLPPLRLGINLSRQQFTSRRLVLNLQRLLQRHRIGASHLEFEITETLTMRDPDLSRKVIEQLKEIGFRIAIDDFGTGHSSLAWLQYLPVDQLKIDGSFLAGVPGNARNEAICRTIVRLGRDLGLSTLVERIETDAQRQLLIQAGCDEGQGHLFSEALSSEDLRRWFRGQAQPAGASARDAG